MTEAEWLKSTLVAPMLYCLRDCRKNSDRKLRLFAAACCRRAWHLLEDGRSQQAVAVGERYADGLAGAQELAPADREATRALDQICTAKGYDIRVVLRKAPVVFPRNAPVVIRWGCAAAWAAVEEAEHSAWTAEGVANRKELASNCGLLRCLFGNPFSPVTADPAWLAWRDGAVVKMGQAAYDQRSLPSGELDPGRLAVLADALEEAGCGNQEMLTHLRGPGPHVRGCWVVDLLLGKG